jgi:serine/threonine protein kinase
MSQHATTVGLSDAEDGPPAPLVPMPRWVHDAGEDTTYELLCELSRGGEGRLFKARQLGAAGRERRVAVKVLTPEAHLGGFGDPSAVLRLWREQVQVMRNFAHAGFASVHVAFALAEVPTTKRADQRPWWVGLPAVVMAWVEGDSLHNWRTTAPRTPRDSLAVLAPCAAGLDAFHRMTGHVHRDLKPANIVVGPDGARVIDYGLLRSAAQLRSQSHLIGTAGYMAPELYRGAEYSPATDLYAFAAIAFFQLTEQHPVLGHPSSDVFRALKGRGCSDAAPLLAKALGRIPETRGCAGGAADLLAQLLAALDGRPRHTRAPPPASPTTPRAHVRAPSRGALERTPPVLRALAVAFGLCALTVIVLLLTNH